MCIVCLVFISVINISLSNYFSVYSIGGQHDGHCLSGFWLPALVIVIFVLCVYYYCLLSAK